MLAGMALKETIKSSNVHDGLVKFKFKSGQRGIVNNVRTIFERQNEYAYIPDFRDFIKLHQ